MDARPADDTRIGEEVPHPAPSSTAVAPPGEPRPTEPIPIANRPNSHSAVDSVHGSSHDSSTAITTGRLNNQLEGPVSDTEQYAATGGVSPNINSPPPPQRHVSFNPDVPYGPTHQASQRRRRSGAGNGTSVAEETNGEGTDGGGSAGVATAVANNNASGSPSSSSSPDESSSSSSSSS